MKDSARARIEAAASRLAAIESHLKHLNPDLVLERGYSIAMTADGAIVHDAAQVAAGEEITVKFAKGAADAAVRRVRR
jgi:exodeoxyribonuclease VII large subunit